MANRTKKRASTLGRMTPEGKRTRLRERDSPEGSTAHAPLHPRGGAAAGRGSLRTRRPPSLGRHLQLPRQRNTPVMYRATASTSLYVMPTRPQYGMPTTDPVKIRLRNPGRSLA